MLIIFVLTLISVVSLHRPQFFYAKLQSSLRNQKNFNMIYDLILAAQLGNYDSVVALANTGIDLNLQDHLGDTALIKACDYLHFKIVQFLIANGVDLNIKDGNGNTALVSACIRNDRDVIKILILNGADINIEAANGENILTMILHGETLLDIFLRIGEMEVSKVLIRNGAQFHYDELDNCSRLLYEFTQNEINNTFKNAISKDDA